MNKGASDSKGVGEVLILSSPKSPKATDCLTIRQKEVAFAQKTSINSAVSSLFSAAFRLFVFMANLLAFVTTKSRESLVHAHRHRLLCCAFHVVSVGIATQPVRFLALR